MKPKPIIRDRQIGKLHITNVELTPYITDVDRDGIDTTLAAHAYLTFGDQKGEIVILQDYIFIVCTKDNPDYNPAETRVWEYGTLESDKVSFPWMQDMDAVEDINKRLHYSIGWKSWLADIRAYMANIPWNGYTYSDDTMRVNGMRSPFVYWVEFKEEGADEQET